ncbi:MAG TPA: protoporphyrinogen oxidase [Terriglobia bacterium]|nr:protoporphyrinogen oxidase [Terriglobia bacterium]
MNPTFTTTHRIAVIGGGITGLAALRELRLARESGGAVSEILIEANNRLGGVIRTEYVDGFTLEAGPDSFLTEKPETAELCRELGLADQMIGSNDAARRTGILHLGRLETLPDGLYFFIPSKLTPIFTTPLLSLSAKFGMLRELLIRPAKNFERDRDDESVAQFIRRHFGQQMLENIVDPLLSGVYGGDSELLSAHSVLPRFCAMERDHGSLIRAILRARSRTAAMPSRPIFTTLRRGLGELIARLTPPAPAAGPGLERQVWLQTRVTAIEKHAWEHSDSNAPASRYTIRLEDGKAVEADAIILALPAYECRHLLKPLDAVLGAGLGEIAYSPALTIALAFDETVTRQLPPGFGFLVPKKEGRRVLACTFVHQKFNHRAPAGKALLRCFLGGAGDPSVLGLDDGEMISTVRSELQEILGLRAEPLFHRLSRWPLAMPQYTVGHAKRLAMIQQGIKNLGGVFLAGNAYSGIGISDCIRTGRAAAREALQSVSAANPSLATS